MAQVTPITTTYEYVATLNESPEANNIIVNLYADAEDSARYGNMEKYSDNLKAVNIVPTPRLASGTEFRALLSAGNKYDVFKLLPQGVDKEAVWKILTGT